MNQAIKIILDDLSDKILAKQTSTKFDRVSSKSPTLTDKK